jgi:hypothetical protein
MIDLIATVVVVVCASASARFVTALFLSASHHLTISIPIQRDLLTRQGPRNHCNYVLVKYGAHLTEAPPLENYEDVCLFWLCAQRHCFGSLELWPHHHWHAAPDLKLRVRYRISDLWVPFSVYEMISLLPLLTVVQEWRCLRHPPRVLPRPQLGLRCQ